MSSVDTMPCISALSMRAGYLDHSVSGEVSPRVAPRRKFGIGTSCCGWLKVGPRLAASAQHAHVSTELGTILAASRTIAANRLRCASGRTRACHWLDVGSDA
jgi:hypothetical protein